MVPRASLLFKKQTDFLDKSSKTIDILLDFFEPKWSPNGIEWNDEYVTI